MAQSRDAVPWIYPRTTAFLGCKYVPGEGIYILFKKGAVYRYDNMGQEDLDAMLKSGSIGNYFYEEMRPYGEPA